MTYEPGAYPPFLDDTTINPASLISIGNELNGTVGAGNGVVSTAWTIPAANGAVFIPFVLQRSQIIAQMGWYNGATVAGNIDAGIYSETGTRLLSTGATAQTTISVLQLVNTADLTLDAGQYYLALSCSLATATLMSWVPAAPMASAMGVLHQAAAHPLPASATFARLNTLTIVQMVFAWIQAQ